MALPTAAGFAACGLDENGTAVDGSVDVTTNKDGAPDVIPDVPLDVVQGCSTLDATACDAALPDGWTYAAVDFTGDHPCPSTDYTKSSYISDPKPDAACICGCTASGTLDCSGTFNAGTQGGCTGSKSTTFDAGNDAECVVTNWNDQHISVGPLPKANAAGASCDASAPAPGWSATATTSCAPNCQADYCHAPSPFNKCIISTASQTCPAPFTKQMSSLGSGAQVVTSCTGCACGIRSAQCNATVTPFSNNDCTGTITTNGPIPTDGACPPTVGTNINSFSFVPDVPAPACDPTASATGNASFTNSITVCCLP